MAKPYRIAVIADPQIIDDYSYGRTGIFQKISEIYPDIYMKKNWKNMQNIFNPDAIIFLGDLMDAGNHDIGFGDEIISEANKRFQKVFGKTSYNVTLGNHSIIVLDTLKLNSSNFPRILLSHVPLYRPPNTDCGPLRQNNRYINQGHGYQYQNLIEESLTNFILDNIKPQLILSGDDHDYCEIKHDDIIEISVNSFSFAMKSNLILLTWKYWKSVGKAIFDILEIALSMYFICWIWFWI
ncbi:6373_t:CDS:2 [Diversispora eburnea]|uniref:6373_t:CDS:1 n=1 Tax=Diversispora eburnea TaxID=1213867 RepID=A0A9N8ZA06_9GLOM|nr:6373_t:CDS:2 [Diversispora eburnea]